MQRGFTDIIPESVTIICYQKTAGLLICSQAIKSQIFIYFLLKKDKKVRVFTILLHSQNRCCSEPYPTVVYDVVIRRKPGFFMTNIILPTLIMSCFAFLSFLAPLDTRISLGVNIFVALSFITSVMAEKTPVTQETPVINRFLIACTVLTTMSVAVNVFTTTLYFYNPHKVPEHVAFYIFTIVAPWVGYGEYKHLYVLGVLRQAGEYSSEKGEKGIGYAPNLLGQSTGSSTVFDQKAHITAGEYLTERGAGNPTNRFGQSALKASVSRLVRHTNLEAQIKEVKDFWRCAAQTVDRMFFILFATFLMACSLPVFSNWN